MERLTSLTYALSGNTLGNLTYGYDLSGNRTSLGGSWARTGLPAALVSATYDAANRITAWGGTSFTYDLNGNLTGDGTTTYAWNARNQLIGLSGGASGNFAYDGVGRRRARTIGGTTNLLHDGLNIVQELTSGGASTANLLTGLGIDETFSRTDSSGSRTLLVDALDSTLALADETGTVQTNFTFEPFGATTTSGAPTTNAIQYAGRENDGTGLYFYRARFYSPASQRFISEDPIGFQGGDANMYAYVGNQPTMWRDPTGQVFWPVPPATFPACEKLRRRSKEPSWWDRLKCNIELGQMLPGPSAIILEFLPGTLAEQLALEEAMGGAGRRIMLGKIGDPAYPEEVFAKMQYVHEHPGGAVTVIHYWWNLLTGVGSGFKGK